MKSKHTIEFSKKILLFNVLQMPKEYALMKLLYNYWNEWNRDNTEQIREQIVAEYLIYGELL